MLFIFRQTELLDKGYLTESNDLQNVYTSAVSNNVNGSATEIDQQTNICHELDDYFHNVLNHGNDDLKNEYTKNIVKARIDLNNLFIKNELLKSVKLCPYCNSPKRKVRWDFNIFIVFFQPF